MKSSFFNEEKGKYHTSTLKQAKRPFLVYNTQKIPNLMRKKNS